MQVSGLFLWFHHATTWDSGGDNNDGLHHVSTLFNILSRLLVRYTYGFSFPAVSREWHTPSTTMPFSTQSPLISKGGTRELMHPRCLNWLPAGTQEVTTPSPAGPAEEDPSRGECSSGKTNHLNWLVSDLLQVATGTLSCQVIGQLKF